LIKLFLSRQFVRFLAVGGVAALLHWLARIVLSSWLTFPWAVALAYVAGMLVAFALNRIFVFPHSNKPPHEQLRDFVLINLSFFPVVWAASIGFEAALRYVGLVQYTQALAHGLSISIPMLATFLMYKFFAFKEAEHGRS